MTGVFLRAFCAVFFAEMADKSQFLALAFATKYPVRKVILGLFLGIFLNHALAVLLGSLLSVMVSGGNELYLRAAAAVMFLVFGVFSFRLREDEGAEVGEKGGRFALFTIASAFFIGELGDKTQLVTFSLAATTPYPLALLAGTVSAMVTVGSVGILVGMFLGERLPKKLLGVLSGAIFIGLGLLMLRETFSGLSAWLLAGIFLLVVLAIIGIKAYDKRKTGRV